MTNETIKTGDTVKGIVAGTFVVLGFRMIENERYAQLKTIDTATGQLVAGELSLPIDAIIASN